MNGADLNNTRVTRLSLENPDEKITVELPTTDISVIEFMELVELLLVNAKYDKRELENYIVQWAKDIKSTRNN